MIACNADGYGEYFRRKMMADEYIKKIIDKHRLPDTIDFCTQTFIVDPLEKIISDWANGYLCDIKLSGSRAKGTAIDLSSDLDLFISLSSSTPFTLKEIYNSLYERMMNEKYKIRKQNVSLGVFIDDKKIDLVPGKRENQYGNDHSLYRNKADTWTKTNIDRHISAVRTSGRKNEIIALKIWKEEHKLEFPSIYLETFAIDNLSGRSLNDISGNFLYLLQCIRDKIITERVIDPANTNNTLSDELTINEKTKLSKAAEESLLEQYWESVIW